MRRRKPPHESGEYQKQTYQNKDNYRLKIVVFLSTTKEEGSYKAEIYKKANLRTNWTGLVEYLNDLIKLGWIEQKYIYNKEIFKLTDNGRAVANHVKDIVINGYSFKDLDIFEGISILNFT